jgi:thioredoxin-related protein
MEHSPQPQPRGQRIWAALCLGIGIVAVGCFLQVQIQSSTPKNRVLLNQPLPSMIVEAAGVNTDLKSFVRGLRCLIVFHSPSCQICREMLPALRPFPPELRLILVNESRDRESSEASNFPGAAVFQDRHRILSHSFGATSLPIMLFVDENGVLRNGLTGGHTRNFVQEQLKLFATVHKPEAGRNP